MPVSLWALMAAARMQARGELRLTWSPRLSLSSPPGCPGPPLWAPARHRSPQLQPPLPPQAHREASSCGLSSTRLSMLLCASARRHVQIGSRGLLLGEGASQNAGSLWGGAGEACYKVAQPAGERGP